MSITDYELIDWLNHSDGAVRNVALDMLSTSYSMHEAILPAIFKLWDTLGVDNAFSEFPMISHLPLNANSFPGILQRAATMSAGRRLTDRRCRCAGKLLESVSVHDPALFAPYLDQIAELHPTSKIFFRVSMRDLIERSRVLTLSESQLQEQLDASDEYQVFVALERLFLLGLVQESMRLALVSLAEGNPKTPLVNATLALVARYPSHGLEASLMALLDHSESVIADAATIGLVRCRSDAIATMIAQQFGKQTRSGQLRSIEVIRRCRMAKASELLRYLLPYGQDAVVQNSIRVAEILVFDFAAIEDWLEAYLLAESQSLQRLRSFLHFSEFRAVKVLPNDFPRVHQLIHSRMKDLD